MTVLEHTTPTFPLVSEDTCTPVAGQIAGAVRYMRGHSLPLFTPLTGEWREARGEVVLQGYLAHKKQPPPRTLQ